MLENSISDASLKYKHKNDYPFNFGWNKGGMGFSKNMVKRAENNIACTLETTYFGLPDNKVDQEKLLELGRCFAKAIKKYIETDNQL